MDSSTDTIRAADRRVRLTNLSPSSKRRTSTIKDERVKRSYNFRSPTDFSEKAKELPHVTGIRFARDGLYWSADVTHAGRRHCKYFSIGRFGFEKAREMALEFRQSMMKLPGTTWRGKQNVCQKTENEAKVENEAKIENEVCKGPSGTRKQSKPKGAVLGDTAKVKPCRQRRAREFEIPFTAPEIWDRTGEIPVSECKQRRIEEKALNGLRMHQLITHDKYMGTRSYRTYAKDHLSRNSSPTPSGSDFGEASIASSIDTSDCIPMRTVRELCPDQKAAYMPKQPAMVESEMAMYPLEFENLLRGGNRIPTQTQWLIHPSSLPHNYYRGSASPCYGANPPYSPGNGNRAYLPWQPHAPHYYCKEGFNETQFHQCVSHQLQPYSSHGWMSSLEAANHMVIRDLHSIYRDTSR